MISSQLRILKSLHRNLPYEDDTFMKYDINAIKEQVLQDFIDTKLVVLTINFLSLPLLNSGVKIFIHVQNFL